MLPPPLPGVAAPGSQGVRRPAGCVALMGLLLVSTVARSQKGSTALLARGTDNSTSGSLPPLLPGAAPRWSELGGHPALAEPPPLGEQQLASDFKSVVIPWKFTPLWERHRR